MGTSRKELEKLLSECPSIRKPRMLEKIYDIVSSETEINKDPFWRFLQTKDLRCALCRYMRLSHVYDDDGESYRLDGRSQSNCRLCVLLRGEVHLSCKGYSAVFSSTHGSIFGSLHLPKSLEAIVARGGIGKEGGEEECEKEESLFRQFVTTLQENGLSVHDTSVSVKKGSSFVYIVSKDLRPFIDRLCHRLSSLSILESLGLRCLRNQCKLRTFRRGQVIVREGEENGHIFLLVKGSCHLFKCQERDDSILCSSPSPEVVGSPASNGLDGTASVESFIGSVTSVSFLGFIPLFTPHRYQPMTVIATSEVRMLVFSNHVFLNSTKRIDGMAQGFKSIADQQMRWLMRTLPLILKAQRNTMQEEGSYDTEANCKEQGTQILMPLEEHNIMKSRLDIENIMNSRIPKNPKLNRHKVLNEFGRLVRNEEKVIELMEYEEPLDPFSRFDFINTEGYDSFGGDPVELEWFPPVEEASAAAFNSGRSLLPFPSILLSRKMHGKTLPAVQQSSGYSNPFA